MPGIERLLRAFDHYWALRALLVSGAEWGDDVRLVGTPVVGRYPGSTISIGARTRLISRAERAALGTRTPVTLRTLSPDARIDIGKDCGITGSAICAAKSVTIGDGVLVGADVLIFDTDFHPILSKERRYAPIPVDEALPVKIGHNVFIGTRAIVCKGVSIGENSVIGAGSVVTKNVPSDTIVAGNPAAIIKTIAWPT